MKLILETNLSIEETMEIKILLDEARLEGAVTAVEEKQPEQGTMNGGDYLPIIGLILSSSVITAGIKGIFEVIKLHKEIKKSKHDADVQVLIHEIDSKSAEVEIVNSDGSKMILKAKMENDGERQDFYNAIQSYKK